MVRISKLTDYAVLLMSHLARASGLLTARDLAEQTGMPVPTVGKLLKLLARAELLISIRGVKGGYRLSRPPLAISIEEILAAVEGPIALTECSADGECHCERRPTCQARPSWATVNQVVKGALERISLGAIIQESKES